MLYIGNHTSSSKGYLAMGKQTLANGGNTFAFFTRNPRGGKLSIDVSPLVFIRDNSSAVKRAIYCIGHRLKIALKCLLHHNSATYTIQQFNFNCKGFF